MGWLVDATTQSTYGSGDPHTVNHTCASDCCLIVVMMFVSGTTARTGGTPTYNGDNLTDCGEGQVFGDECGCELWYRINPDTGGSYQISVPNTGNASMQLSVISFYNVSGRCVLGNTNSAFDSANVENPGVIITVAESGELCVGVLASSYRDVPSARPGFTLLHTYDAGNHTFGSQYDLHRSPITTDCYFLQTKDGYGIIGALFRGDTFKTEIDHRIRNHPNYRM